MGFSEPLYDLIRVAHNITMAVMKFTRIED
jgi:hypothetical protein